MEFPKYQDFYNPILKVLNSGELLHYVDLGIRVRDEFFSHLPPDLLNLKTRRGSNKLLYRINWAKSYLKMGKFVEYPQRGMVQITEKGKKVLLESREISSRDLRNDPDFVKHRAEQTSQRTSSSNEESFEEESPQDLIESGIDQIENQVKKELLEKLAGINPYYFEKVILILLEKMGYGDMVETPKSRDGGIDGIINQDKLGLEKIYIQAKRYADREIREKHIRDFIGAMSGDTAKGIFVTTSSFNEEARKKAREAHHKIILIDGRELATLMYRYGVGVQARDVYEIKGIDEDFFEEI